MIKTGNGEEDFQQPTRSDDAMRKMRKQMIQTTRAHSNLVDGKCDEEKIKMNQIEREGTRTRWAAQQQPKEMEFQTHCENGTNETECEEIQPNPK